jgi:hypothetical protein
MHPDRRVGTRDRTGSSPAKKQYANVLPVGANSYTSLKEFPVISRGESLLTASSIH